MIKIYSDNFFTSLIAGVFSAIIVIIAMGFTELFGIVGAWKYFWQLLFAFVILSIVITFSICQMIKQTKTKEYIFSLGSIILIILIIILTFIILGLFFNWFWS